MREYLVGKPCYSNCIIKAIYLRFRVGGKLIAIKHGSIFHVVVIKGDKCYDFYPVNVENKNDSLCFKGVIRIKRVRETYLAPKGRYEII